MTAGALFVFVGFIVSPYILAEVKGHFWSLQRRSYCLLWRMLLLYVCENIENGFPSPPLSFSFQT